jgi:predicted Zn-dependent protease
VLLLAGAFAATLLAPGCAVNPATGKHEISLVSEGQEISLGKESDVGVQAEFGLYDNPVLAAYVERVGQKLAAASERPDLEWHFRVLDSPVVNAFALPGGYIYVTRGILAVLNSEAQLAGVLGHEIGHVTARHGARQMTRQQIAGVGLGLGVGIIKGLGRYSGLAEQGLGLLFLKYSRGDETQADELGVRYATRAGYDPREIPATYDALKQMAEKGGQSLPGFLSTHPDPGQREVTTRQLADAAVAGHGAASLQVAAGEYKRELADLVYGDDPREGYAEKNLFYHPGLRFQLAFPVGWTVQNTRQSVTGVAPDQKASVEVSIARSAGSVSPADYVRTLVQKGSVTDAQGGANEVNGWPAWVGQIAIARQDGTTLAAHAAWVARDADRYFQFLGVPADPTGRAAFSPTLLSFKGLADPAKLGRQPDRVQLVEVTQPSATVSTVAKSAPALAIPLDEVAFLNHTTADAVLRKGFLLKVVRRSSGQ